MQLPIVARGKGTGDRREDCSTGPQEPPPNPSPQVAKLATTQRLLCWHCVLRPRIVELSLHGALARTAKNGYARAEI